MDAFAFIYTRWLHANAPIQNEETDSEKKKYYQQTLFQIVIENKSRKYQNLHDNLKFLFSTKNNNNNKREKNVIQRSSLLSYLQSFEVYPWSRKKKTAFIVHAAHESSLVAF